MPLELPRSPRDSDYEDLVSATLIGLGYFVEASLKLKEDTTEVLELDAVATSSKSPLEHSVLVEAKSGSSAGIRDMFKMFGWMTYLSMPRGVMARAEPIDPNREAAIKKLSRETGVRIVQFDAKSDGAELAEPVVKLDPHVRMALTTSLWWGRIGQRCCQGQFNAFVKRNRDQEWANRAREYRNAVDNSFFAKTPIGRAARLYSAYSEAPKVSRSLALGECGSEAACNKMMQDSWGSQKHPHLQYSMILETTARLGVLKNAMLHITQRASKNEAEDVQQSILARFPELFMPSSFKDGIRWLSDHEYRALIPYLMQVFIEGFGGFYFENDDRELKLLSDVSGIPSEQISECLSAFDHLFPIPSGWFFEKNGLKQLKMIPGVYRGTGSFLRQQAYQEQNYSKCFGQMGWLLGQWHNALYYILEPKLGVSKGT